MQQISLLLVLAFLGGVSTSEDRELMRIASEVRRVFLTAERVELFSLDGLPDRAARDAAAADDTSHFHGYPIVGRMDLTRRPERSDIVRQLADSIARGGLGMAACFYPRHGIRAVSGSGKPTDLLICFECSTVYLITGDRKQRAMLTGEAETLINSVLSSAGIKLGRSAAAPD